MQQNISQLSQTLQLPCSHISCADAHDVSESNTPWSRDEWFLTAKFFTKGEDYPSSALRHLLPTAHSSYLLPDCVLRGEPWSQIALHILQSSSDNLSSQKLFADTLSPFNAFSGVGIPGMRTNLGLSLGPRLHFKLKRPYWLRPLSHILVPLCCPSCYSCTVSGGWRLMLSPGARWSCGGADQ